jgi:hypothetical protein
MHDDEPKDELDALVRALPSDVTPPADLWLDIESRLGVEESTGTRALDSLARRLPAEIAPPERLWQAIAARLTPRRANTPSNRLAVWSAAAALAAIAVLAAILFRGPSAEPPTVATEVDVGNTPAGAARERPWIFNMPAIDPAIAAEFLRSLELVQQERLAIESAIETSPDNLLLRELWARAYTAELELNSTLERTIMTYQRGQGI